MIRDDLLDPIDLEIELSYRGRYREADMQWSFDRWLRSTHPELLVAREFLITQGQRPDFLGSYELAGMTSLFVFELKFRLAGITDIKQLRRYVTTCRRAKYDLVTGVLVAPDFYLPRYQPEDDIRLLPVRMTYHRAAD